MKIKITICRREIELPVAEARKLYLELAEVFAVKKNTVPVPLPEYSPPLYIGPIVVPAPQYPPCEPQRFVPYSEDVTPKITFKEYDMISAHSEKTAAALWGMV